MSSSINIELKATHKRERHHIFIQFLKVISEWLLPFIDIQVSTFITNVRLNSHLSHYSYNQYEHQSLTCISHPVLRPNQSFSRNVKKKNCT